MKDDKKIDANSEVQQRPEDAEKQNAQQEREYREQKDGKMKMPPEQATGKKAIEDYEDLMADEKRNRIKKK